MVKDNMRGILLTLQEEFKEFRKEFNEFKIEVKETLVQHSHALVSIESTLKIYGDMYDANRVNIEKLDKRVSTLEAA